MGIEPTGDGTRLPQGFEDPGEHQSPIQPHINHIIHRDPFRIQENGLRVQELVTQIEELEPVGVPY